MNTTTKTRAQRRMEKKQALIILVLVLAVSLASFTLGVFVGRRGVERDLALQQQKVEKILVTQVPQKAPVTEPAERGSEPAAVAAEEDSGEDVKLTFYDKLAKEEATPLGSGINLPPEERKPIAAPPIPLPEQPIVKKQLPVKTAAVVAPTAADKATPKAAVGLPPVDPKGSYSVQVGSFATAGDAGALKQKLIAKGYPAFVAEADLGAKGLWYRVRLGPYAGAEAAKSMQQLIAENEQIKGFISRQ